MGNAFVACEVVYCIDSYRIQSAQPSTLHTTPRLENGGTHYSVHQSVRLQLHGCLQP